MRKNPAKFPGSVDFLAAFLLWLSTGNNRHGQPVPVIEIKIACY
jgi:hypothetical protein